MWKLEALSAQIQRMMLTMKQETPNRSAEQVQIRAILFTDSWIFKEVEQEDAF